MRSDWTRSLCASIAGFEGRLGTGFQPGTVSILFAATTNGVAVRRRMSIASYVCGWNPSVTSTTSTAISASAPPRERSVENE
ncbi:MAG: hypothetical protein J07HX64_00548 [halophilic archaeon J07HX64]|nr:MAG: hypothetical protein J07HX64_00548 [halophilic archaeon J07HX64]